MLNMNKTYYMIGAIVVLGGLVFWLSSQGIVGDFDFGTDDAEEVMEAEDGDAMEDDGDVMMEEDGDAIEDDGEAMEGDGDAMEGEAEPITSATISFTGGSFEPSNFTVDVGATVTFKNISLDKVMWPATALHPTHTIYPGSSIGKCGTDEAGSIFDACSSVDPGDSYSFTFDEVGEWKYHNHLKPSTNGSITVK